MLSANDFLFSIGVSVYRFSLRPMWLGLTLSIAPHAVCSEIDALHRDALTHYQQQLSAEGTALRLSAQAPVTDRIDWQLRSMQSPSRTPTGSTPNQLAKLQQIRRWLEIADGELAQFKNAGESPVRNINLAGLSQNEIQTYLRAPTCQEAVRIFSPGTAGLMLQANQAQWLEIETHIYESLLISTAGSEVDTKIEVFADRCPDADTKAEEIHDDDLGLFAEYRLAKSDRPERKYLKITGTTSGLAQVRAKLVAGSIRGTFNTDPVGYTGRIEAYQLSNGNYLFSGSTSTSSSYNLSIEAGDYYLAAFGDSSQPFLGRAYPNVPCYSNVFRPECRLAAATPVRVIGGQATNNINFTLDFGAQIFGRVTGIDLTNGGFSFRVNVRTALAVTELSSAVIDETGRYSFRGLPPGTFEAYVRGNNIVSQLYSNINCSDPDCRIAGAAIVLADRQIRTDINFAPPRRSQIHGQITFENAAPGAVLGGTVKAFNLDDQQVTQSSIEPNGQYSLVLLPGRYTLAFFAGGHVPEIHFNLPCNNQVFLECSNFSNGTPVELNALEDVRVDASLTPLGSISGRVRDETGAAIAGAQILVCPQETPRNCSQQATTDATGNYTARNVTAGEYYVVASSFDHVDFLYSNLLCQPVPNTLCDPSTGNRIQVSNSATTANIDFLLPKAARISGRSGTTVGFAPIKLIQSGGTLNPRIIFGQSDYTIYDLRSGTYQMMFDAPGDANTFTQIFANRNCAYTAQSPCNILQGDIISLVNGQWLRNIDFDPLPRKLILGNVRSLTTGLPIADAAVDFWLASPPLLPIRVRSTLTDSMGNYRVAITDNTLANRSYFVSTDANSAHINQVHNGIQCPVNTSAFLGTCDFVGGTTIILPAAFPGQIGNVDFVLRDAASVELIFQSGFE
jgi:hypothetical protein